MSEFDSTDGELEPEFEADDDILDAFDLEEEPLDDEDDLIDLDDVEDDDIDDLDIDGSFSSGDE